LEKKTASDVWRARIGYAISNCRVFAEESYVVANNENRNVQVTLQILAALIEKAPRDLPLYAPYVLKILNIILRSRDVTMVESSIPTFEAFCEHNDGASLSADQEYLHQYEEIVQMYASFASTRPPPAKGAISAPVAMRWRSVGLQAIKSVASSEALASVAGRQLDVTVPILLENIWTDNGDFMDVLEYRAQMEEKEDTERMLRRRTSVATVRTVETSTDHPLALSATTADADKLAEEDIGVLAIQCLKHVFVVNNRSQIHGATTATLKFIADRVAQDEKVIEDEQSGYHRGGWATRVFEMIARWTPVQDRYVILVTAMDELVRSPLKEDNLQYQLVLATMADSLLKSDINLIGLSVMDVLLGLIQHVLRVLQLDGAAPHLQQDNGTGLKQSANPSPSASIPGGIAEISTTPTGVRVELLSQLQQCIGDLATHVYYADQISDMVSAILLRLKPSPLSTVPTIAAAIENPSAASAVVTSVGDLTEDPNTDGFFSFDTAKVKALEAIKAILLVASHKKSMAGGSLGRNRVPVRVWEGTQWLLRDPDGRVRKAYVDALLTWLDKEMTKSDLRVHEEKPKGLTRTSRDDSATNLSKRAASGASNNREKPPKPVRTTFLQLLHLAVYENALQYIDCEPDIILLHLLLVNLVDRLGVNAVKNGLPMIFRLQEDILEVESPMHKIRMGSLCHGYFWTVSEKFDFESSPIGRVIYNEIGRRKSKTFWVDRISLPPVPLGNIGTPGTTTPQQALPRSELESGSLLPFDDRFQMVKLISLSYAESISSPPQSPPTSPGRSFSQPILSTAPPKEDASMPEAIKDQMMSEWSRESVIAMVQEGSKTVSLNGSRSGTNATGPRNFLAVNGGTNSGSQSPQGHHHPHPNKASSMYGLVGSLGALQKLRKANGQSPSPASESSRGSVTRVDQLKRVLSGQQGLPGTKEVAHSDASSESMVSYDFTASDVSFNPGQQNLPPMERSVSLREPNHRDRSKSRERVTSPDERARPLTSHPVLAPANPNVQAETDLDAVPPVPPLPASLTGEPTAVQDHALKEPLRKGRSVKRSGPKKREQTSPWGEDATAVVDLQSLLNGIDTSEGQKGNVGRPPY